MKNKAGLILEYEEGADISDENRDIIIIRKPTSQYIKIRLKEEVIPGGFDEFFKLKKKILIDKNLTEEQKMKFQSIKKEFKNRLMSWDSDKIFEFEKGIHYEQEN